MGLCPVRDVVTHPGAKNDHSAILQLRMQFTSATQQQMTFLTPVIRAIADRIVNHAHANLTKLPRTPDSDPGLARILDPRDRLPIDRLERDILQSHS